MDLFIVGVVPDWEEVGRLVVYLVVSIACVSFWLGLAILLCILFHSLATSALAVMALWIFSFFIGIASELVADALACPPKPLPVRRTQTGRRRANPLHHRHRLFRFQPLSCER